MLEARLKHATTLKRYLDAAKDLVNEVTIDCNDTGLSVQSMDTSHVVLIALLLRSTGFEQYRCDRNMGLGIKLANLNKVLKSTGPDDVLLLRADDKADTLSLIFENSKNDAMSEYQLKLMDIDGEYLGIPDTEFEADIEMASSEFKRIVSDMINLSESVSISVTKEGINFSAEGDIGSGSITLKPGRGDSIDENEEGGVVIDLKTPVSVIISTKFLVQFTKATPLSNRIVIGISSSIPAMFEYKVSDVGYIRYYIAPKVEDDE